VNEADVREAGIDCASPRLLQHRQRDVDAEREAGAPDPARRVEGRVAAAAADVEDAPARLESDRAEQRGTDGRRRRRRRAADRGRHCGFRFALSFTTMYLT
jgi:hypothetical protein